MPNSSKTSKTHRVYFANVVVGLKKWMVTFPRPNTTRKKHELRPREGAGDHWAEAPTTRTLITVALWEAFKFGPIKQAKQKLLF